MQLLIRIYRRLDLVQGKVWFRIAASVLAVAVVCGFFGKILIKSYDLDSQRQALTAALSNQNYNRGDPNAISLRDRGEVIVGGRLYGGEKYLTPRIELFDKDGNVVHVSALVESLIYDQRPNWAPGWLLDEPDTTWMLGIGCAAWLLLIVWMRLTIQFIFTLLGTAIPVALCWFGGRTQLMLAFGGIGLLTFTFMLLTRSMLLALNQPYQIPAVAHTVIKEASRRGLALVFIILLLVVLPLLPLMLNPDSPLRFRIQSFISLSIGLTFTIAAVLTLFFSCASVAFEIRDRQIWQLMTKPVARLNYLVGKWLGVLALNLIILTVAGISTFMFIQYLSGLPVEANEAGQYDSIAVRDEVLSARLAARPAYQSMTREEINTRVEQIIRNDPDMSQMDSIPAGQRKMIEQQLVKSFSAGQRSVPVQSVREYLFQGLGPAKSLASSLTVRYKFYILGDDEHKVFDAAFIFNRDMSTRRNARFVPSIAHAFPIPSSWIQDDGSLRIAIANLTPIDGGGAINFEEDQFEVLYKAGTFEGNFVRAMLTVWIKLAFLAALGVCCATFLSFPVACLLSFTIFIAGVLGPYLAESLEWYYPPETSQMDWGNLSLVLQWAFESVTRYIALGIVFLLSSFGEYRPTQALVEGRLIPWSSVFMGFAKLVLMWSGLAMVSGYLVLRKRQLAIYSGQG